MNSGLAVYLVTGVNRYSAAPIGGWTWRDEVKNRPMALGYEALLVLDDRALIHKTVPKLEKLPQPAGVKDQAQ